MTGGGGWVLPGAHTDRGESGLLCGARLRCRIGIQAENGVDYHIPKAFLAPRRFKSGALFDLAPQLRKGDGLIS